MSHYWLLISCSWFGSVSLQYINTGGPGADTVLDPLDLSLGYPLPYLNHFNIPMSHNPVESYQNGEPSTANSNEFRGQENIEQTSYLKRKRRTTEDGIKGQDMNWLPNLIDSDKTTYLRNDDKFLGTPFVIQGFAGAFEPNITDANLPEPEKKSFSPWGGKRTGSSMEHMWTWKRAANIREPSMPKRVRFSPWGGKRSGQLIYKPGGNKASRIIFSASMPEVTRVLSNYSPNGNRFNLAGFQLIPSLDKRHPIRFLTLSTKFEKPGRDALPFNTFFESLPKLYKPGHPYADVNLKKDGKRKVKFSAWGGKRSPPIIGPIWTPPPHDIKEPALNAILLIRNSQDLGDKTMQTL